MMETRNGKVILIETTVVKRTLRRYRKRWNLRHCTADINYKVASSLPGLFSFYGPFLHPIILPCVFCTFWGAVRKSANSDCWFRHVRPSTRPSAWKKSVPTGGIFMKFDTCIFFENLSTGFKFHYNLTRITGTLRESVCTFTVIPRWIVLEVKCFRLKLQIESKQSTCYDR
jgi:hypothetical protein